MLITAKSSKQLAICSHKTNAGGGAVDNLCPQSQQRYVIPMFEKTRVESK